MTMVHRLTLVGLCLLAASKVSAEPLTVEQLSKINALQQSQIQRLSLSIELLQTQIQELKTASLQFMKTEDANSKFVSGSTLNSRLASYVQTSTLNNYATTQSVALSLGSYVTTGALNSRLAPYVTGTEFRNKMEKCRIAIGHSDNNRANADRWGDIDWAFDFDRNALKLTGDVNADDTIFYDFGCFW